MGFFTSNFRIAGKLPQAVAISQGVPRGWKGRRCLALAPPWALVKERDEAKFRAGYESVVLSGLDAAAIAQELGDGAILLCWEAPGKFCHRMLVAEWLRDQLGIEVKEYEGETFQSQRRRG